MNEGKKARAAIGSGVSGALLGWIAIATWAWTDHENERSCADSDTLCLPIYQAMGLVGWLAAAVIGYVVALRILDARPLKITVPACTLLTVYTVFIAAQRTGGVPEPSWLFFIASAAGPALVTLCTDQRLRRFGILALGLLLVTSFFFMDPPSTYL